MPTDRYHDGSPRYDHGHDPVTGATWWAAAVTDIAALRRCPACGHEHAVLTTCHRCQDCRVHDLTAAAREVFGDLLSVEAGHPASVWETD